MDTELTIDIGTCLDLKATVSGAYPSAGAAVTVEAWPKGGKHEQGCSGNCTIDAGGKWSLPGFQLLRAEYFSEAGRVCCVQAMVQLAGQIVHSTVKEVAVDIPYEVSEQTLVVKNLNALACAISATDKGERSGASIRLGGDMIITAPILASLRRELDGDGHTLTHMYSQSCMYLFDSVAETGVVKSLKVTGPDWRADARNAAEPPAFAGIVRENKGRIEKCEVSLKVSLDNALCGGIAFDSAKGSKISDCKVSGSVLGRSVGGVVYRLSGGVVENCTVTADFEFGEFCGGIAALADQGAAIRKSSFKGKFTTSDSTFFNTRSCGGAAAWAGNDSKIETCSATLEVDMWKSGMGGYVGGIVGKAAGGVVCACGVRLQGATNWIYGGVAGKVSDGGKVEQCAVGGEGMTRAGYGVVGGVVGDLGAACVVSDCFASQHLKTAVYGGGLIGCGADDARVERCCCTSALEARSGGGAKVRGKASVEHCAVVCSYLCGAEEMGRTGFGKNITDCIAYKGTGSAAGKAIDDTGESLKEAADFRGQTAFSALGWNFTDIWEMDAQGVYPKLRKVTLGQAYSYPFLTVISPSGGSPKFKTSDTVAFSGFAPERTSSLTWSLKPKNGNLLEKSAIPVQDGRWMLTIGRFAARNYQLILTLSVDGTSAALEIEFTVE